MAKPWNKVWSIKSLAKIALKLENPVSSVKVVCSNESCYLSFDRRRKICIGNEFKSGKSTALNPDRFNSDLFHYVILRAFLSFLFWASEDEVKVKGHVDYLFSLRGFKNQLRTYV